MKKHIMIFLSVIFVLTIFTNKVNAEEITYLNIDYNDSLLQSRLELAKDYLDSLQSLIDEYEPQGFSFKISFLAINSSEKYGIYITVYKDVANLSNFNNNITFTSYSSNQFNSTTYFSGTVINNFYYKASMNLYGDGSTSTNNNKINTFRNYIENYTSNFTSYSNNSFYNSTGSWNTKYTDNNLTQGVNNIYYYLSDDIKSTVYYNENVNYRLKINDVVLNNGDSMFTYYDFITPDDEIDLTDLPNCYNKIKLDKGTKYVFLSGLKTGEIYIPRKYFGVPGGRLSYFDNSLESQLYDSIIQNYELSETGTFVIQKFDLSTFDGADYMLFNKYLYLEGEDNYVYTIYTSCDLYNSIPDVTENLDGAYDYDYKIKDEEGNIIDEKYNTVSLSNDNKNIVEQFQILINQLSDGIDYVHNIYTDFYNSLGDFKIIHDLFFHVLCIIFIVGLVVL